jgi:hypothetical protein
MKSLILGKLRHFIIPSQDRWLHVLMDGVPHIKDVEREGAFSAKCGPEALQ